MSGGCFFEHDPELTLARRALAEGVGTLMLVLAVSGAGLAAQRLTVGGTPFSLLMAAIAGAGALAGLIVAFGPLSGGHFNPLITILQWIARERKTECMVAYVLAQIAGGASGAMLANRFLESATRPPMFPGIPAVAIFSEFMATAGLLVVVRACSRIPSTPAAAFAVAAWLSAAIIATPTLSMANPAIVVAALFSHGPLALDGSAAVRLVGVEFAGALAALAVVLAAYPKPKESALRSSAKVAANRAVVGLE